MKYLFVLFILTSVTFTFAKKPDRFSHADVRMIMEKNSVPLQKMKVVGAVPSVRVGVDDAFISKVGVGCRYDVDWTYPLAVDVGANVFYSPHWHIIIKRPLLAASLEGSVLLLMNTYDNLPVYIGCGVELKSSTKTPLLHPKMLKVPKFMYSIPMPESHVVLGKTLKNDAFVQARCTLPIGPCVRPSIGINYGFAF